MSLSKEQEIVLQKYKEGKNIFVTGPGGTGKSFLLKEIIKDAENNNKRIQVCSTTGRSAVLLNCGARTIHSWSGIRIPKGTREEIISKTIKRKTTKKSWKNIDILIVDEISMMSQYFFEILNDIGKITRRNYTKPFGGLQIIFIGDFFQLSPVEDDDIIESSYYCFESDLWKETFELENHIKLTKIFRQKEEKFIKILNQIREGRITKSSHEILTQLVDKKYIDTFNAGIVPVRLFPTRAKADNFNRIMYDKIESEGVHYKSTVFTNTKSYIEDGTIIPEEIINDFKLIPTEIIENEINNLIENSPCVNILSLKIGTNVMLTYNLNIELGLCNGTLGIVLKFENQKPVIQFMNGIILTIDIVQFQSTTFPCISFTQYPLKHAWGLTIHNSQGASLDMAEIDIGSGIFTVGQTYVALSRVKTLEGLYLINYDPTKIKVSKKVIAFYNTF